MHDYQIDKFNSSKIECSNFIYEGYLDEWYALPSFIIFDPNNRKF